MASNIMSRRSQFVSGEIWRMGLVSYSSSRSKSTSISSSVGILPCEARRSFQHMILARTAKSLGSMAFRSSLAYTAKCGKSFTITAIPRVHTVEELSRNSESKRLLIRGSFGRILAAFEKDGEEAKRSRKTRSCSRAEGAAKCMSISLRRSLKSRRFRRP